MNLISVAKLGRHFKFYIIRPENYFANKAQTSDYKQDTHEKYF